MYDITKLIDDYGDDVFALALIVTKDFNSAKEVFVRAISDYYEIPKHDGAYFELISKVYTLCQEVDSNEIASTLTGIELDSKRQAVLEQLLVKRETVRAAAHMYYANELSTDEIATITGKSEKYISGLLMEELSEELRARLDDCYMDICAQITAEDSLKAYVIRSVYSGDRRMFEVREEAVPVHTWKTSHKVIVIIVAIIATLAAMYIIPVLQKYGEMRESEAGLSYEEVGTDESFYYTYEAETVDNG